MIKKHFLQQILGAALLVSFFAVTFVSASDLTSTSFIIRDPLVGTGGSFGSSTSFKAFGSGDMTNIGRSTSTSFEVREGFLWYPYVIQGVFTAVASGSDANLSWGASTAGLGWNVSGYKTGKATVSGGPYTYTTHGLVTSYTYSGLTPGPYCFVLQTLDAFSNVIATSPEQCVTIVPTITFTISDNSVGFGTLSSSANRYATGNLLGSPTEPTNAHTITAATNGTNGYVITAQGTTLASGINSVSAISGGPTTLTTGFEQFGIRAIATGGSGSVASPYNGGSSTSYGYSATPTVPVSFASSSGVTTTTTYDVNYAANISTLTEAGNYSTNITYIMTSTF